MGRGGRRPGAGRKPNHLKRIVIRSGDLARLSQDEIRLLNGIAQKLATPVQDGPGNQIESKPAIEAEIVEESSYAGGFRRTPRAFEASDHALDASVFVLFVQPS